MAYHENTHMPNTRSAQYYDGKYDYVVLRKSSKEKKCPIYVHNLPKAPVYNMANTSSITTRSSPLSQASKSILDKLEESYWATWKPPKESHREKTTFRRHNKATAKNTAYGDVAETLIKYFGSAEFDTSSATAQDVSDQEVSEKHDESTSPEVEMHSQEIQTESVPDIKADVESDLFRKAETPEKVPTHYPKKEKHASKRVKSNNKKEKPIHDTAGKEAENPMNTITEIGSEPKILTHTDSLIITKKKQSEVKETFQQPKCIKLHKKTTSSFIARGGSYPLKSCFKKEPLAPGNFRLGAPGSPLFVTANSFNKKYCR